MANSILERADSSKNGSLSEHEKGNALAKEA
jgi:hypothetical protein